MKGAEATSERGKARFTTHGKRGRPREIDKQNVARIALELFEEKGVDGVTMNEIARASSISRRTLFRLFPGKADLVWDGVWELIEKLNVWVEHLEPNSIRVNEIKGMVVLPVLARLRDSEQEELARRRLQLLSRSPALFSHPCINEMEKLLSEVIQKCKDTPSVPHQLLATSLVSVSLSAMLWWATTDESISAEEAVCLALDGVSEL